MNHNSPCNHCHCDYSIIINISDGWATDDLVYKWKDVDPVQIVPGLHLPRLTMGNILKNGNDEDKVIFIRFTLEQYKSAYCNVITNTGEETLENF